MYLMASRMGIRYGTIVVWMIVNYSGWFSN